MSDKSGTIGPTAAIVLKGLVDKPRLDLYTEDLMGAVVYLDGERLAVASAYFPFDSDMILMEIIRLVEYCEADCLLLLMGWDANSHNQLWGSANTNPWQETAGIPENHKHGYLRFGRGPYVSICDSERGD